MIKQRIIIAGTIMAMLIIGLAATPIVNAQSASPAAAISTSPEPSPAPEIAVNQCPTASQSQVEPSVANTDQSNTRSIAHNFLLRAFSYRNLSQRLRCDPLIVGATDAEGKIIGGPSIYNVSKNLVNFGVLLALLVIAFANILRIKLDTYAVKKAVPLLVFGVVMANLSLPLIRTIVDFSGVLTATFIGEAGSPGQAATREVFVKSLIETVYVGGSSAIGNTLSGFSTGSPWQGVLLFIGSAVGIGIIVSAWGPMLLGLLLLALLLWTLPAILFMWLGLLFVARIYVLVILAAVAPVAFATLGFEPLKGKVWGWWWSHFFKWTFMAPATFALMWIAIRFHQSVAGQPDIGTYIISLVMLALAVQIPMKMGGTIMASWSKYLAGPFKDYALKGFSTGGQALRVATSRSMSQPTKLAGGRITLPPTNLAKSGREFVKVFEEKGAKDEASSQAARTGRWYGRAISTTGLTSAIRRRSTGRYSEEIDFENANQFTDQLLNRYGGGKVMYNQLTKDQKLSFNADHDRIIAGGDADQIIGAYLANMRINRSRVPQKKYLDALKAQGIDTTLIENIYSRGNMINHGMRQATPGQGSTDEAIRRAMMLSIDNDIRSTTNQKQMIELMSKMVRSLEGITKDDGTEFDTNKPEDVREMVKLIAEDPTLFARAHGVLNNKNRIQDAAARQQFEQGLMGELSRQLGRFVAQPPSQVLQNTLNVVNGGRPPTINLELNDKNLADMYRPDMTDPARFSGLPSELKQAMLYLYDPANQGAIKSELEEYFVKEFKSTLSTLKIGRADEIESLIEQAAREYSQAGQKGNAIPIDRDRIEGILSKIDAKDKTDEVLDGLRTYNIHAEVFGNMATEHASGPTNKQAGGNRRANAAANAGNTNQRRQSASGAAAGGTTGGRRQQAATTASQPAGGNTGNRRQKAAGGNP